VPFADSDAPRTVQVTLLSPCLPRHFGREVGCVLWLISPLSRKPVVMANPHQQGRLSPGRHASPALTGAVAARTGSTCQPRRELEQPGSVRWSRPGANAVSRLMTSSSVSRPKPRRIRRISRSLGAVMPHLRRALGLAFSSEGLSRSLNFWILPEGAARARAAALSILEQLSVAAGGWRLVVVVGGCRWRLALWWLMSQPVRLSPRCRQD
jgi:hypothetical protein